jgi:ABC-type molybdenum transport system ATPase subunit/photorepair protein PhrA
MPLAGMDYVANARRGSPVPVGGNESFPRPAASGEPLLELDDLTVWLEVAGTRRAVLRDVSLSVDPGESVGLVGEGRHKNAVGPFLAGHNGSIADCPERPAQP